MALIISADPIVIDGKSDCDQGIVFCNVCENSWPFSWYLFENDGFLECVGCKDRFEFREEMKHRPGALGAYLGNLSDRGLIEKK